MAYTPYIGSTLTLTSANTNYNLFTLLQGYDANAPPIAASLSIQADNGNGANFILVGDVNLSGTNYGYRLDTNGSRTYQPGVAANIPVSAIYVRSDGTGKKIDVELFLV